MPEAAWPFRNSFRGWPDVPSGHWRAGSNGIVAADSQTSGEGNQVMHGIAVGQLLEGGEAATRKKIERWRLPYEADAQENHFQLPLLAPVHSCSGTVNASGLGSGLSFLFRFFSTLTSLLRSLSLFSPRRRRH